MEKFVRVTRIMAVWGYFRQSIHWGECIQCLAVDTASRYIYIHCRN